MRARARNGERGRNGEDRRRGATRGGASERGRTGVLAMLSTLEGELPRTRGPNPLFWTHTLAHLSLAPNHLQLTLPPPPSLLPHPPSPPVHPCRTYCRLSCLLRGTLTPSIPPAADTAHCPECCVVASPGVSLSLPLPRSGPSLVPCSFQPSSSTAARPPRSILYNYPACITKVAAKLFPLPPPCPLTSPRARARDRPFQPPTGQLREPVRLTLFLCSRAHHSSRVNAIHRGCFFRSSPATLVVPASLRATSDRRLS